VDQAPIGAIARRMPGMPAASHEASRSNMRASSVPETSAASPSATVAAAAGAGAIVADATPAASSVA
jgi:hypothetical protein